LLDYYLLFFLCGEVWFHYFNSKISLVPLHGIDLWEHVYYLRINFIKAVELYETPRNVEQPKHFNLAHSSSASLFLVNNDILPHRLATAISVFVTPTCNLPICWYHYGYVNINNLESLINE